MTPTPLTPTDNRPLSGKALQQQAVEALKRCLPIAGSDAQMMADITRHSPLDRASQAQHDSTEYESEKLVRELPTLIAALEAAIQQQPEPVAWFHQHVMKASNSIVESWLSFDANEEPDLKTEPGTSFVVRTPLYAAPPALPQPACAPGLTDAERATWLADKIAAHGDYAKEAAQMLRRWPSLQQKEEPSGWKLVPVEPTFAMLNAFHGGPAPRSAHDYWRAMLAAAPSAAEKPAEDSQR